MRSKTFYRWLGYAALGAALILCGCPPFTEQKVKKGEFLAKPNKLYDRGEGFDIKDRIVYPAVKSEGLADSSTQKTNRELAMLRCGYCHGCGFDQAFDKARYGQPAWEPKYKGAEWQPIVKRMLNLENSMLNEEIAERIYNFLRDSTTGKYDESKDLRGAKVVEAPKGRPAGQPNAQPH
jgi:hypothetical protein